MKNSHGQGNAAPDLLERVMPGKWLNLMLSDRLGSWAGAGFFIFWIGQRFYFNYYPSLLWWLITFQFVLFVAAYLSRSRARIHARGFMEIVYPFFVAALPLALDNYPFKPRGFPLFGLVAPYVGLMIMGSAFIVVGVFFLRRSFSIMTEVREPVFSGIYRLTRHPMYLGSMMCSLGLTLYFFSWVNAVIFLVFCTLQIHRAGREERKIAAAVPAYRDYASRVGWFWMLGRKKPPG